MNKNLIYFPPMFYVAGLLSMAFTILYDLNFWLSFLINLGIYFPLAFWFIDEGSKDENY